MRSRIAIVAALALLLTACGSGEQPAPGGSYQPPRPAGVQDPAVIPTTSAGPAPTCDPLASLRPSGSLPGPGAMPAGGTMARIAARGRLIIGVDQNNYLFGFRDAASGEIVGFDVDIAKEVATAIFGDWHGHVQLIAITSAQRIPYVRDHKVDIVARSMTMNCERWQQVSFSTVYYDAGQKVLVPKDSAARGIEDLGGKKVCASAGSTSIVNIVKHNAKAIPVAARDTSDCLVLLQQGQVDAISTDDAILAGLAAQDPTTKVVGAAFTSEPYGLAIDQNAPDFVRFVNAVLERMRADGTWASIYRRWLGGTATPPPARYRD